MGKPIEWLEAFQVNTGAAATGVQGESKIVGLSNGNILVAWVDYTGTVGGSAGTDINGKIYDSKGVVVRDSFQINAFRAVDDERDFDVAATNDGGFILAYMDLDGNQSSVIWERLNANGSFQSGRQIADENVAADFLANPQIAVNQNNDSSFVTFTDDVGVDTDVRGVRLDPAGVIVTAEFNAAQNGTDINRDADSAILKNGNLVTVYEESDSGVPTIEFRINLPNGVSVKLGQGSNTDGTDVDPQVTSLRNGGFVVVWNRIGDPVAGPIDDVQYRVFDKTGAPVTGIKNAAASSRTENEPDVVALPDGDFVIVWDDDTNQVTKARRYNSDGSPDGGKFKIFDGNATNQDLGVTADGRILATWTDVNGEIFASIWDPRGSKIDANDYDNQPRNFVETDTVTAWAKGGLLKGTNADNLLVGSVKDDKIKGGKGDDVIFGRGGDDEILGGRGNDEMRGGGGSNILDGQKGFDTVSYAEANKAIVADLASPNKNGGRAKKDDYVSIEGVEGTAFDDEIKGDSKRNTLIGNDGEDYLVGRDGDDTLMGGNDEDKLKGGRDDDDLWGGLDGDRFIFKKGEGDDTVWDFEVGVDKFVVGKGASNLGDLDLTQFGLDTLVEFSNVTVLLKDVLLAELSASDFIL